MINREDMMEITRRMTSSRTNLIRLAGAYIDDEGYVDGTFNTSFLSLKGEERKRCLDIAKAIPYAKTNKDLISQDVSGMKPGTIWQMLYALIDCELKNDALLLTLYEVIAEKYAASYPYAIYVYYGAYDVPIKAADKTYLDESEEVYKYIIIAISPTDEEQIPMLPKEGLLYPAFSNRSSDTTKVYVYHKN